MTGTEGALVITAFATLVTSVTSAMASFRNGRKIDDVHRSTNSRMDELIAMNRKDATAIEKQRVEDVKTPWSG
jgi:hypothetical protein